MTTRYKPSFFKYATMNGPRMSQVYEFLCDFWYVQYSLNRGNVLVKMAVSNFLRTPRVPFQPFLPVHWASSGRIF